MSRPPRTKLSGRGKLSVGLVFILALAFYPSATFAHARLLRSQPAANATSKQSPKSLELWFSEELQPPMCSVTITDKDGNRVDKNNASPAEGNKKLQIDLEDLGSGTYTVEWRVLSIDEHPMKGNFTFTVALAGGAASAPTQTSSPGAQRPPDQPAPMQSMPQTPTTEGRQESGTSWTQSLVRWLEYLGMMMLFGGFAFHLLVLAPSLRQSRSVDEVKRAVATSTSARRVVFFSWLSLALLVIVSLASLVLQASTVFDKGIGEAFSPGLLNQVITMTGFGASWRLEVWAILALLIIVFYLSRRIKHEPVGDHGMWWWVGLTACAVLFPARSWTGHAAVAAKEFPFAVGTDWLHLLAAGFWVGGLFHMALTMPRALSVLEDRGRLHVLHRVIPLFTRLAVASTILIVMRLPLSGFAFLLGYIVLVGVASFLEKFSMKQLNPYQVNFLMAIGMAVTAIPALWIKQGSLTVPMKALPLGAPIGLLMALGSICFVLALSELPVGMATGISTSYVLLVMLLSWWFLDESMNWMKVTGALLTITGVALLSWQQQ